MSDCHLLINEIGAKSMGNASLTVIVGPMGSGKTAELLRIARVASMHMNVLCVGHLNDLQRRHVESGAGEQSTVTTLETHAGDKLPGVLVHCLAELEGLPAFKKADLIVIDEGQFYKDLMFYIEWIRHIHKKSIAVGLLDSDSNGKCFQNVHMTDLVIHATRFYKLAGTCSFCTNLSTYTICLIDKPDQILAGGLDIYAPVCSLHAQLPLSALPARRQVGSILLP